jgi:hypothetical protein
MLHAWERPQMPTKFIRILSECDHLEDVGVDNVRIVSKLFQSFVGHIYRVRTSADAEDHTASYALFKKS